MLINIFFDKMNSTLELVLIGIFFFALYWFIMRKYNSLGLRLLLLCVCLFIGCTVWIYKDEVRLKNTIANGQKCQAEIISKSKVGNNDNAVRVSFTTDGGRTINTTTTTYISQKEWDQFRNGDNLNVLYVPKTSETYVEESLLRFKGDKIYLYYFAAFWLVLGTIVYIWLRKYKVGVDESGNEWVEKPDGKIILDERGSAAYRAAKQGNIISKLIQTFGK